MIRSLVLVALTCLASSVASAPAMAAPQKSQAQVLNEYVRRLWQKVDSLEKKQRALESRQSSGGGSSAGGEVNLDALPEAKQDNARPTNALHHGRLSTVEPGFKVFFDLNLVSRPNVANFTFANYHTIFLFEMLPNADLQFSFDIAMSGGTGPRFYELDYQVSPKVQVRAGKIWIPFDDMAPHNIFGGRVNVSTLNPGQAAFLPDLWTDLGVGVKFVPIDTKALRLTTHAYVVNGFQSGGTDPLGVDTLYPSFSNTSSVNTLIAADQNRNKAIGGRAHALFAGYLGLGASFYTGRWTPETSISKGLTIIGVDGQLRIGPTEIRAGLASMSLGLPSGDSVGRGGYYGEIGSKFGGDQKWKGLIRMGNIQLDNRAIDVTDQQLVGATLLWKPGLIEYSLQHSRDLKDVPGKLGTTYTALRMVVAL